MDQRRTGPDRNSSINPVCLYGEFTALGNRKVRYAVCLTESELVVQRITSAPAWRKKLVLSLKDCVGCRAYREDDNADPAAYMAAYFYPLKRRWTGSGVTTQKGEQCFRLAGLQDPRANLEEAEKWARAVRERAARQHVGEGASVSVLSRPCRIMLLLNPQSGKGQALALYNNYIKRMLGEAGIQHSLVITERQNYARELVKVSDLSQWDALVIMSGDGLLFEVINGLLERPDWEEAIRTPLGILPGGSGNGLAASVHHYSRTVPVSSEDLLVSCGFLLCKGLVSRMDLASIQLSSGLRLFSCLSLAWGFVADVDIESEKYRHVGAARFTVGTLVRLVSLRIYKGKLAYLPATEDHNQDHNQDLNQDLHQDLNQDLNQDLHQDLNQELNQELNQDHNQDHNQDLNQDHIDQGLTDDPTLHCKDETSAPSLDSDPCRPPAGSPGQNTFHNSCQSNNAIKARRTESRPSESTSRTLAGPSDTLLPPLDQPLPSSWVVVQEEDFVLMLAVYQSHLAEDLMAAPGATLNDGVIHLFYVRAGIKRTALLNLFLAMEKGVHLSAGCQHLVHTKVRALRLVPYSPKGIITVDGEAVDYGPVQAEVHRGMARFICG